MANFTAFFNRLKEEYPEDAERGKEFANICKWFLENDPTYSDTFKNIWLWREWPDRETRGFGQDIGIDLVAETHTGNLWAIQSKCYVGTKLETEHITSFLSLSGRADFTTRLLISTGKLSKNGMIHIQQQEKPVQCLFYDDLDASSVNWLNSSFVLNDRNLENRVSKTSKTIQHNSDPKNASDYFFRGVSYVAVTKGEHEKAKEDYSKALELDPSVADIYDVYFKRGDAFVHLGDYEKAIEDYSQAIKFDSNDASEYFKRGNRYKELGKHQKAIEDYSKAIEFDPIFASAYHNRGVSYGQLGEHEKAIEDYSKAIELHRNFASAYTNRGVAYEKLGKHQKAIEDFSKAIEVYPNSDHAYHNRGVSYGQLGEHEKAIEDYSKAIELWPYFADAYLDRSVVYEELGEHEKAKADRSEYSRWNYSKLRV